MKNVAQYLN